jgi:hypothetical protein
VWASCPPKRVSSENSLPTNRWGRIGTCVFVVVVVDDDNDDATEKGCFSSGSNCWNEAVVVRTKNTTTSLHVALMGTVDEDEDADDGEEALALDAAEVGIAGPRF